MSRTRLVTSTLLVALAAGCAEPGSGPLEPVVRSQLATSANFLLCPTDHTRSASALIGILGGTLAIDGHSMTLPPGAVLRPTRFTITVPASPYVEVDIDAAARKDFHFITPAEITISYQRCDRNDIATDALHVWHVDERSGQLIELIDGIVDEHARSITFPAGHLSGFIIAN